MYCYHFYTLRWLSTRQLNCSMMQNCFKLNSILKHHGYSWVLLGLNFAIRKYCSWLMYENTYVHRETNNTYIASVKRQKSLQMQQICCTTVEAQMKMTCGSQQTYNNRSSTDFLDLKTPEDFFLLPLYIDLFLTTILVTVFFYPNLTTYYFHVL